MRRPAIALLLLLPLTAAGTLAAHAVAYRVLDAPSEGVHGYLGHVPQVVIVLALPLLLALAVAGRTPAPRAWPFAAAAVGAFVAQEHLERLAHTGELPFLLDRPVFLVGLALQVPFAVAAWLVARMLIRVAGALRQRRTPDLPRPVSSFLWPAASRPRSLVVPGAAAPRGPPAVQPAR